MAARGNTFNFLFPKFYYNFDIFDYIWATGIPGHHKNEK